MQYKEYINFEDGNAARQAEVYRESSYDYNQDKKVKKMPKKAVKTQNKASIIFLIACAFSMTILLTYRYNVISEKNLQVQELKEELDSTDSLLKASKVEVESNTDFTAIEAYAKQKLGMQKPSADQIVYVDSSLENNLIENKAVSSWISSVIASIKVKFSSVL